MHQNRGAVATGPPRLRSTFGSVETLVRFEIRYLNGGAAARSLPLLGSDPFSTIHFERRVALPS